MASTLAGLCDPDLTLNEFRLLFKSLSFDVAACAHLRDSLLQIGVLKWLFFFSPGVKWRDQRVCIHVSAVCPQCTVACSKNHMTKRNEIFYTCLPCVLTVAEWLGHSLMTM